MTRFINKLSFLFFYRENDETIGFGKVDERISGPTKATTLEAAPPQKMAQKITSQKGSEQELRRKQASLMDFDTIAGDDEEIDYLELKGLLDRTFQAGIANEAGEVATTSPSGGSEILCNLYDLCCGLVDKNSEAVEKAKTVLMSELKGGTFSKEICRCIVAMLDTDFSGKLGREEFSVLWELLSTWKKAFLLYDIDNSGSLSGFELRNALSSAGYRLTNHVLNILMHRYGNEKREITFDEFMLCAVRLKTMIDKFEHRQREDVLILSREEWVETTLYC